MSHWPSAADLHHRGTRLTIRAGANPHQSRWPPTRRIGRGRLRVSVRDTGPGIPPEKISRLFIPFERLGLQKSEVEGTGIGLALSKSLVELMAGGIGVESRVGEGSTFWVEFPLAERSVATSVF